jgi:fatty-acyl-CoA synthase
MYFVIQNNTETFMKSTMQDGPLGLPLLMRHVASVNGRSRIGSFDARRRRITRTFAELAARAGRLGSALEQRGFGIGAVIGTLAGASPEHLEAYLGVPASERVLHTINPRLHADQIVHVASLADDEALIVDASNLGKFREFAARLPRLRLLVTVGGPLPDDLLASLPYETIDYEALLVEGEPRLDWPIIDEHETAILCFTGGTTGLPKGVGYSHRSVWLQAMSLCTANSLALGSATRLLPAVPLYHVNGWGLPFAALMAGADLALPGASLQPPDLLALIDAEGPTLAAGVPTIWSDLLAHLRAAQRTHLGTLTTIACGGAQVPRSLVDAYAALGVRMLQAWGMTETSSMSAISQTPGWIAGADRTTQSRCAAAQGRVVCGLEARVADLGGTLLPSDGASVGEIQIRGPWVTRDYLGLDDHAHLHDGWLRTGDLGTIDADGFISLTDRVKDAIKSGGEWIPSLALEEAIRSHPAVLDVAVVALPDARWQERPGAAVVLAPGHSATPDELAQWLVARVAKWWLPERWAFVDALPRTAVGKMDKKRVRQLMLERVDAAAPAAEHP